MSSDAKERVLVVAAGALVVLLGLWPWPLHPTMQLGEADAEMAQHLAMLWKTLQPEQAWMNWPEGFEVPVQDKVHIPLAAIAYAIHPALAPALIVGVDLGLAYAGGFLFSRELGAGRLAAVVGGVTLGTAPFLGAMATFGFTECLPLGLLALHAACLLRLARTGSLRDAALCTLTLAAYALSGWYLALFGLFAVPVLLALCAQRTREPRTWALLLGQGLLAALLVSPAVWDFAVNDKAAWLLTERGIPVYGAGGPGEPAVLPHWRYGLDYGSDPLNYVLPTLGRTPLPRSTYLGLVALALGAVSLRRREARVLGGGVLLFLVLGLGHYVGVAGRLTPIPSPVALLTALVDPLRAIEHWYRAAGVAMVFLAPMTALALPRLRYRSLLLAALVAADATALSDVPWPRSMHFGPPPPELLDIPGDGPLLVLPFQDGARAGIERTQQRWLPYLARPISENYEGPDALMDNAFVAWVHNECSVRRRKGHRKPPRLEDSVQALRDLGLEKLAVVKMSARWEPCERALREGLGEPDFDNLNVAWWEVSR